jgi:putative heme iron utilization protein
MTAAEEEEPDPAAICRRLMRRCATAALATRARDDDGAPYASLVQVAAAHDGSPLLLLSGLAEHTKNIAADSRASLLFDGTQGRAEPLTGARVTVQGRIAALGDTPADRRLRRRYLARHPEAAAYAGFADFGFYRVTPERLHLVAGFGRILWLDAADALLGAAALGTLAEEEDGILDHMNADHADAIELYAQAAAPGAPSGWRLTGIDPEGLDLRREAAAARLEFRGMVNDGASARRELAGIVKELRSSIGKEQGT